MENQNNGYENQEYVDPQIAELREIMADLISSQHANSLEHAYRMAENISPEKLL